jgi:nucleoside-diphosphate-sugar epimerase
MKIIVTGASGWLGREFVSWYLTNVKEAKKEDLILLTSENKSFDIPPYGTFHSHSLWEFNTSSKVVGFVHLAFILRHRVSEFGKDSFRELNTRITDQAAELISTYNPEWVVNVSSGAIFNKPLFDYSDDYSTNPYGFMKLREEKVLSAESVRAGSNIVIGRLWGASGSLMPINRAYALSDFIYTGIKEGKIRLTSNYLVRRRYGDAGQFMGVLLKHAVSGITETLNSGGDLIELGDLAKIIKNELGNVIVERPEIEELEEDNYYPHEGRFEDLAEKYAIDLLSLEKQVQRTISGHKRLLS